MNQEKNRNFKKKQVDSKKKRPYYQKQNQDKPHYRQQYHKKKNPNYFYQKKDKEPENNVYKQDLIQIGFQSSERTESLNLQLAEKYPNIFNPTKRKVIIQKRKKTDIQKVDNIEEIKKDFKKLIENEDIPDWFLDEEEQQEQQENTFDFGDTVERTVSFQKDLERVHEQHGPLETNMEIIGGNFNGGDEDFSDLKDMDFAQLDAYLEKKAQKQQPEDDPVPEQNNSVSSTEHSGDYFDNLEKNIKNMLESSKDDFEDDSDESFAEQLGFNYESDMNKNPNVLPLIKNQQPQIVIEDQHQEQSIQENEGEKDQKEQQKIIEENKEEEKDIKKQSVTPEELEMRKKFFMQKYGYLDQILCQLVYEILNSKKKLMLNKLSINGFNQESVEKYCENDYKIFSMYTQGNILPKIWFYKDKDQEVKGPFMSYDMDIWNGEKDFFTPSVEVSVSGEIYMPIELYLNRDPQVIQIVEEVLTKLNKVQESASQQKMKYQQKRYKNNNNNKQQHIRKKGQDTETEEFPALGNAPQQKTSHGQSLISTLTQKTNRNETQKVVTKEEVKEVKETKEKKNNENQQLREQTQQKATTDSVQGNQKKVKKIEEKEDLKSQQQRSDTKQKKEKSLNKNKKDSRRGNQKNNKNYRKKNKKQSSQRESEQIYYKKKNQSPKKKAVEKNEELTNDLKNLLGLQFNVITIYKFNQHEKSLMLSIS